MIRILSILFLFASQVFADDLFSRYLDELQNMPLQTFSEKDLTAAKEAFDLHTAKSLPLAEKYLSSMMVDGDRITFSETPNESGILSISNTDRLYIFMSSSVPDGVWQLYAEGMKGVKNAVFVLRGCIGGCGMILPTINFIKKVGAEVHIDPLLFRLYGVTEVPTFVYATGVPMLPMGSEGDIELLPNKKAPAHKKSVGDWSFEHHIKQLQN